MLLNLMDIGLICWVVTLANFRIYSNWDDKEITKEIASSFVDGSVDDPNFVGVLEPWRPSLTKLSSIPMGLLDIYPS